MSRIGLPHHARLAGSGALGRTIAAFRLRAVTIELDQLGIVYIAAEGIFYGVQIGAQIIRGELHPVCQPIRYVLHEGIGGRRIVAGHQVAHDQLCVRVQRGPGPDIASAFRCGLGGLHIAFLGVAEGPDFIALDALGPHVANVFIMADHAGFAGVHQKLRNSDLARPRQPCHGADTVTFTEKVKNIGSFGRRELVHGEEYTSPCLSGQA